MMVAVPMSFQSRTDGLFEKPKIRACQAIQPERTSSRLYGFRMREDECYYGMPIPT